MRPSRPFTAGTRQPRRKAMSSRDDILTAIRANAQVDRPLPFVPRFDDRPPPSLLAAFKDSLHRMGGAFLISRTRATCWRPCGRRSRRQGRLLDGPGGRGEPGHRGHRRTAGAGGHRSRHRPGFLRRRRDRLHAAQLRRSVAHLAQHLIVPLDPADIVANLHHAYRRPELHDRH